MKSIMLFVVCMMSLSANAEYLWDRCPTNTTEVEYAELDTLKLCDSAGLEKAASLAEYQLKSQREKLSRCFNSNWQTPECQEKSSYGPSVSGGLKSTLVMIRILQGKL